MMKLPEYAARRLASLIEVNILPQITTWDGLDGKYQGRIRTELFELCEKEMAELLQAYDENGHRV